MGKPKRSAAKQEPAAKRTKVAVVAKSGPTRKSAAKQPATAAPPTLFLYRPDSDRFDSIAIVAKNSLKVLDAIQTGGALPTGARLRWFLAEERGDFPSLMQQIPVLTTRALEAIKPLLGDCCRVHDLRIEGQRLHALEVTHVVDCLDRDRSKLELFDGQIEAYDRLALQPEAIPDALFFKIKGIEDLELFCSPRLFDLVAAHKLTGLQKKRATLI